MREARVSSRALASGIRAVPSFAGMGTRERAMAALSACDENQTHAARMLGVSRRTLASRAKNDARTWRWSRASPETTMSERHSRAQAASEVPRSPAYPRRAS